MINRELLEAKIQELTAQQKTAMENIKTLELGLEQFRANVNAINGAIEVLKELLSKLDEPKEE